MINMIGISAAFMIMILIVILATGIWIWALVDCLISGKKPVEKLLWIIVIFLFNIIGAIIYFALKDRLGKDITASSGKDKSSKSLTRSKENRVVAGVCGGLGEYLDIDPVIIRLAWALLTLFSIGTGIIIYIIAALIIPEGGSNNSAPPGKRKSNKSSPGKVIAICAAVVLGLLIIAIFAVAIFGIMQFSDGGTSVSQRITQSATPMPDHARKIAYDRIINSYNYKEYGGHNLMCKSVEQIDDDSCRRYFDDPYGVRIYTKDCFKVTFTYAVESNESDAEGFKVEAIVIDNSVRNINTEEIKAKLPTKQLLPPIITTEEECRKQGYEVLYPDCEGCPPQCLTKDGAIDLDTAEDNRLCKDLCGDGICQEMVCAGEGCPCPESKESCPEDCA